jgi:hypothetical protein
VTEEKNLQQFLIVYDTESGGVEVSDFGDDAARAANAYTAAEAELGETGKYEVVLIGADSLETIHVTHAHYFERQANGRSLRSGLLASAAASSA